MRVALIIVLCLAGLLIFITACSSNKKPVLTTDEQHVRNIVNSRSAQLQTLYRKHYSAKVQSGGLNIKLFITEVGTVQNAEIITDSGSFTPEFISAVKNEVLTWRFVVKDKLIYSFKIQFRKG